MKVYNTKELHRKIRRLGWIPQPAKGSHIKYTKDGRTMSVPSTYVNRMVLQRLNKEFSLGLF